MLNIHNRAGDVSRFGAESLGKIKFRHRMRKIILFFVAMLVIATEPCEAADGVFDGIARLFGRDMNDVIEKVSELAEEYSDASAHDLEFSPDGEYLAVASNDNSIIIWSWRDGKIVEKLTRARGANDLQGAQSISFSPDGRFFAACHSRAAGDIVVRIWDAKSWSKNHDIVDHGVGGDCSIKFSPDGETVYRAVNRGGSGEANFIAYNTKDWQQKWHLYIKDFTPIGMAISPDGNNIALLGTISIVPPGVKNLVDVFRLSRDQPQVNMISTSRRRIVRVISSESEESLMWSADGCRIILNGAKYYAVYDASSGAMLTSTSRFHASMKVRSVLTDRYFIESNGNGDGTGFGVNIWNGRHDELLKKIPGNVSGLAISRGGNYLAAGFLGHIVIWRLE